MLWSFDYVLLPLCTGCDFWQSFNSRVKGWALWEFTAPCCSHNYRFLCDSKLCFCTSTLCSCTSHIFLFFFHSGCFHKLLWAIELFTLPHQQCNLWGTILIMFSIYKGYKYNNRLSKASGDHWDGAYLKRAADGSLIWNYSITINLVKVCALGNRLFFFSEWTRVLVSVCLRGPSTAFHLNNQLVNYRQAIWSILLMCDGKMAKL